MKNDLKIRKFEPADVDAYIRLVNLSFAEESLAAGITPEDYAVETRRIFRWRMLPYKLLTALMGVQWEAFVAEKDGKVVGGGMYIGKENRMTITNLMVDPAYRRQGIGQALLVERLERLAERRFPYVMAQVLSTNQASLGNLKKQHFEVFNQYSVYERDLPWSASENSGEPDLIVREINRSDRALLREIESKTTDSFVLFANGSVEMQYCPSSWQRLYSRFAGYTRWAKALELNGETIGFVGASFHRLQCKGDVFQPIVADENLKLLPVMFQTAGAWLGEARKEAMIVEVPDHRTQIGDYLIANGWRKRYTWLELIRWLDESARRKYSGL